MAKAKDYSVANKAYAAAKQRQAAAPKIRTGGGSPNPGKIKGSSLANLSPKVRKEVDAWNANVARKDKELAARKKKK